MGVTPPFFMFYTKIIDNLRDRADEVILFHSATGKDSIMLLDVLSKKFVKVHCVFMYIVKGLDYENRYISWAEKRYPNCTFRHVPHYALASFIRNGYLGIEKDVSITKTSISTVAERVKAAIGVEWSVYGFKKIDGITRRVMLNGYPGGIFEKTKKAYPLMDLKNGDVLNYIQDNNLIPPFCYDAGRPSSGCDISQPLFLNYLRSKYPGDLQKIHRQFPDTKIILFKYDNYGKDKEGSDQAE